MEEKNYFKKDLTFAKIGVIMNTTKNERGNTNGKNSKKSAD